MKFLFELLFFIHIVSCLRIIHIKFQIFNLYLYSVLFHNNYGVYEYRDK